MTIVYASVLECGGKELTRREPVRIALKSVGKGSCTFNGDLIMAEIVRRPGLPSRLCQLAFWNDAKPDGSEPFHRINIDP